MRLTQRGPNTVTSKTALRMELKPIHEEGFAVNGPELAEGLLAIAAPVRGGAAKALAALGLSARTSTISLEELVNAFGPHLVATADRISAQLGYRRQRRARWQPLSCASAKGGWKLIPNAALRKDFGSAVTRHGEPSAYLDFPEFAARFPRTPVGRSLEGGASRTAATHIVACESHEIETASCTRCKWRLA